MSVPPPPLGNAAPTAPSDADREVLAAIRIVVGPKGWLDRDDEMAPYLHDQRGLFVGRTLAVVRPADTDEVAAVVSLCAAAKLPIVPQGGNTGLVVGSVPDDSGRSIVLSLSRMNRIRAIDPVNFTMTVDAGCVLASLQQAATEAGRLFPLSLGAEGSCMIGGNLSTNAGGVQVLRYGNARSLVLGLEVVLPDGRIWDGLRALRKDNTGYDLKQLFMGAEGTLGIITGAVLRLFPQPRAVVTAFAAVPRLADVMALLGEAQAATGEAVRGFELVPEIGVQFVTRHIEGTQRPLATVSPWYLLMEFAGGDAKLRDSVEGFLTAAFEAGRIADATIAESEAQARQLWRIRETLPEAQTREGGSIKHDVSVPISRIADLIEAGSRRLTDWLPGARPFPFGHVGDGNIHFNVSQPPGMDKAAFIARWDEANRIVHDLTAELNGSFSAEHGIGRLKRAELTHYRSDVELDVMRKLKAALDPDSLMNPGVIL
jgi:D-lactate dehydrogenase (cytochrome)